MNWKIWLYRWLVIIAAVLMIVSFIMPWWTLSISEVVVKDAVRIYGYGLQHSLEELRSYIAADETPIYQTVLAWVYLSISAGLVLFSTWIKGKAGRLLLGTSGLIYAIYPAVAVFVVVTGRIADFDIPLQGWSSTTHGITVLSYHGSIRAGYYLASVSGIMCIILALLRDKIAGNK